MNICGVTFKDNGKIYNFHTNDIDLEKNDNVIVETEKGQQYAKVVNLLIKEPNNNLKKVIRKATTKDYNKYLKNISDAKFALKEAKIMADSLGLNMQIIDATYTFERSQLLLNFLADERVDFRELVKKLASKYKTRIELHQIGVRDKSKEIGGIGHCGRGLCCATFLNQIDTISINMAKNQNIALNPSKINGACGRLLCCLSYEDDQYSACRKELPNIGEIVEVENKKGPVVSLDILNGKYKVNINNEIKEVSIRKCNKNCHKE